MADEVSIGVVCYVCGQSVATVPSYNFHVRKCGQKFLGTEAKAPRLRRRPVPPAPTTPLPASAHEHRAVKTYNKEARAIFDTLMPNCLNCGRRFAEQPKVDKHMSRWVAVRVTWRRRQAVLDSPRSRSTHTSLI